MIIKIDQNIFDTYPEVLIGVVVANNIDNRGTNPEIEALLRKAEREVPDKIGNLPIIEHSHIAPWREAYKRFGTKPKEYPSSIENLIRRTLKGERVRHINKLVDIYNYISLKYLVPVGGEDLDKVDGEIILTFAGQNENPVTLLGEKEPRPPYLGEVIYKDNIGTICRRWNWKEADRTKLTEETKKTILVIEALPPVDEIQLQSALKELEDSVNKYCGGKTSTSLLTKTNLAF